MPPRSKIKQLPEEVRTELDAKLKAAGFADYIALSEWLTEKGFEISKSSLQRYGRELEIQLKEMAAAIEEAKAIVETCPDDENSIELATAKLAAWKLYNLLKGLDDDGEGMNLSQITRAIADLNRSSIGLQKFRSEVKSKAREVAREIESKAKSSGLSDSTVEELKRRVLGIAE